MLHSLLDDSESSTRLSSHVAPARATTRRTSREIHALSHVRRGGSTYHLLAAPLATWRGRAGRVDLPPQGPAELLSHPAAAVAPRRSCVRGSGRGPLAGKHYQPPQLALGNFCCCVGEQYFGYPLPTFFRFLLSSESPPQPRGAAEGCTSLSPSLPRIRIWLIAAYHSCCAAVGCAVYSGLLPRTFSHEHFFLRL